MGKLINLMGREFNRLTVIKRVENDKNKNAQWLCKCNCGSLEPIIATTGSLNSGNTQSCGCLQVERLRDTVKKYNTYDLTGKYGIGYTFKDEEFYFDLEDFDLIKDHCWHINRDGYVIFHYEDKTIFMHRLVMNCPDDMDVDHIFHKEYDNRKKELRLVNKTQNQMNKSMQSNNTSGVVGVTWDKSRDKWMAKINVYNKCINLGRFDKFDNAVRARKEAEIKYFGEYRLKEKGG